MSILNDSNQSVESPGSKPETSVDQLLDSIKNEHGERKFKTVEDAIKGYVASQDFITNLKSEKVTLESQLKQAKSLEELLAAKTPKAPEAPKVEPAEQKIPAGLTPEDVIKIIEQRNQQQVADANIDKAAAGLQEAYGAEWEKVSKQKILELGLTPELADSIAAKSPETFLSLLGVQKKAAIPPGSTTSAPNTKPEPRLFNPFKPARGSDLELWHQIGEQLKDK